MKVKGEAVVQKYESDGDMLIAHLKGKNKFNIYLSKDDELNQKNRFDEAIRSRTKLYNNTHIKIRRCVLDA